MSRARNAWFFESGFASHVLAAAEPWMVIEEVSERPGRLERVSRASSSFMQEEVQVSPIGSKGFLLGLAFNRWHQLYEDRLEGAWERLLRQTQPFKLPRRLEI